MPEMISKSADVGETSEKTDVEGASENYKKIKPEGKIGDEESNSFWNGLFKKQKTEKLSSEAKTESMQDTASDQIEKKPLGEEEKIKIKEETGWSDEIINAIGSWKEYEVYKNAGLVEAEIDGKKCLIRNDIDWEQKDAMGRTNKERAEQGLSPINKDGKVIELHHIGQHADSPLAELTPDEHRGKGNDTILHDKTKESEIDRQAFAGEKNNHWMERAKESEGAK